MFDGTNKVSWGATALGVALTIALPVRITVAYEPPRIGKKIGELYPDFLFPKVDGGWGRLSDFREKKVILIHFASW